MGLHSILADEALPKALKRPLVFGDIEQIEALREIDTELQKIATEKALMSEGNLKKYIVEVSVEYYESVEIYAVSPGDAKEKVSDGFDMDSCDFEVHYYPREIKPKRS